MYDAMKHSSATWLKRKKQNPGRKPLVAVGNRRTVFKEQEDLKGIYGRYQIQPISQIF